ncbi:MAG: ImmA/IrrE family metallo-endopeptidase [Clostridia bacterium]|nr:ImmA/IrrE family metallo-endopeptidase [Clostridia bacterium]
MNYIVEKAVKLSRYSDSRNPFEICDSTGVNVVFADIGELKGMYKYIKRNRYIVISDKLDEITAKTVCAHELGHDVLHRNFAKDGFWREYTLFGTDGKQEYEANLFAAELLVSDSDILELSDCSTEEIARNLSIDENLICIKLSSMKKRGYDFGEFTYQSDFLGSF